MNRGEKLHSLEDGAVAATDHQPHVKFDKEPGAGYNIYLIEECCGATGETPEQTALGSMTASSASQLATISGLLQRQCDWTELGHFSNPMKLLTISRRRRWRDVEYTYTTFSTLRKLLRNHESLLRRLNAKTVRVVPQQT